MRLHREIARGIVAIAMFLALLSIPTSARAASINYGNFGPISPGITFQSVTESSGTDPVPLFGPPTSTFVTGLNFAPSSFVANSSGGAADTTDGQLNFTVTGTPQQGVGIQSISLFEAGDYTLLGVGTAATQAIVGAIIRVTVLEIDGVAIAPLNLAPSNAAVGFNLVANPGVVQPWSLGLGINIQGQLPGGFTIGATKVEVSINNQLNTLTESGSLAFMAKKEFQLTVQPAEVEIPEPGSAMLILGACGMAIVRRRRS